jgi:hypothetical protein
MEAIRRILLVLALLAAPSVAIAADRATQQRFQLLCEWSRDSMPRTFESQLCDNAVALQAADNSALIASMSEFWTNWINVSKAAEGLRDSFDDAYKRRYPPPPPKIPTAAEFQKLATNEVCRWWRRREATVALDELKRRAAFAAIDIAEIKRGGFTIGMSEQAMVCSLGEPTDRNRTVNTAGTFTQHIYGRTYIYTENGIITSWQD